MSRPPDAAVILAAPRPRRGRSFLVQPVSVVLPPDRVVPLFVWGVWALMLGTLVFFVLRYGSNLPFHDEWMMTPFLTGDQPIRASWLWSLHNEHRLPLPRLLLLALFQISGRDFRSGMFFNVLALGAMAFLLILGAKKARGKVCCSDAVFPLVLLNWGHFENLLWSWQVGFTLPTLLAGVVLFVISVTNGSLTRASAAVVGICLLLLPLCGAVGPAYVIPLGLWLGYAGAQKWHAGLPHARRDGLRLVALSLGSLLLTGLYFVGFESPGDLPRSPSLLASWQVLCQFLSLSVGPPGAMDYWPWSGVLVVGLVLASALRLGVVGIGSRQERVRAFGLLALLAGVAGVGAGIGYGRAGLGVDGGFVPRYVTLAVPVLCCVYLAWSLYGGPIGRRLVPAGLLAMMILLLPLNTRAGAAYGTSHREHFVAFQRDLLAGMPCSQLADLHTNGSSGVMLGAQHANELADYLRMLKRAHVGLFRSLKDDPLCREVAFPLSPSETHQIRWDGRTAEVLDSQPSMTFALDRPRYAYAIRLRCSYDKPERWCGQVEVSWRQSGRDAFSSTERTAQAWLGGAGERGVLFWVTDRIDEVRIQLADEPCKFTLAELVILEVVEGRGQDPPP